MQTHSAVDIARCWWQKSAALAVGNGILAVPAPADPALVLAELCALALAERLRIRIVVPDDRLLPDISNALDLDIRPLCLVLPAADFVAPIALRASLSLLKSRLNRHEDTPFAAAWDAQQQRLAQLNDDWQWAMEWAAGSDNRTPWPQGISQLFAAQILPPGPALAMEEDAVDCMVLLGAEHLPGEFQHLTASRVIRISMAMGQPGPRGALVPMDENARLRATLDELTRGIAELELELATAQAEMAEFTHRYHDLIGTRMVELDSLQARIAMEEASRAPADPKARETAEAAQAQAEGSRREQARYEEAATDAPHNFKPSSDLKKLFRQIAQKIHPDRARNEEDRAWRTRLMAEANRAYRSNDEGTLREVLGLWEEGRPGDELLQSSERSLTGQVDKMQRRLAELQQRLNQLYGSRFYELFLAARMARRQQRDLLQEMADSLDLQIAAAQARLSNLADPPVPASAQTGAAL